MAFFRFRWRSSLLREAGAAILFFGALVHQPGLERAGRQALSELAARGYRVPSAEEPLRVYPAKTGGSFTAAHAAGWRPGVIALRPALPGGTSIEQVLRHELMHEAGFRTCNGGLPLWADEAAAMAFSGEADRAAPPPVEAAELEHLRRRIANGSALDETAYRAIGRLVADLGWPEAPCALSPDVARRLQTGREPAGETFSHILLHLSSGRVMESGGDMASRHPPGSLLKIPFAAALHAAEDPSALGEELAASDSKRLLRRVGALDLARWRLLLAVPRDGKTRDPFAGRSPTLSDSHFWSVCLGERDENGAFPLQFTLPELALVLRASLLSAPPGHMSGLARNGTLPGSTLFHAAEPHKHLLKKLRALAKTGTVSDPRGNPLSGFLMVAWPSEDPAFLALFRGGGRSGTAQLPMAARRLQGWAERYGIASAKVRVRLMGLTPRGSWEVREPCLALEWEAPGNRIRRSLSLCGDFEIISTARGSRSERRVAGIIEACPDDTGMVLETDPETYADGVIEAEAQGLAGEALRALRAIVVWNGLHGRHRHSACAALCDTTHCMLFQGAVAGAGAGRGKTADPVLLRLLNQGAARQGLKWLSFSQGGEEQWERRFSGAELAARVEEPRVLAVRRERTREGEVAVHLAYGESEERVPCEVLRRRLSLPSCPERIEWDGSIEGWRFSGIGAGHGLGLSVTRAQALAAAGQDAAAILSDAYFFNGARQSAPH